MARRPGAWLAGCSLQRGPIHPASQVHARFSQFPWFEQSAAFTQKGRHEGPMKPLLHAHCELMHAPSPLQSAGVEHAAAPEATATSAMKRIDFMVFLGAVEGRSLVVW